MDVISLYHGSRVIVEHPALEHCRPFNDYGPAFYCTQDLELAKEWACGLGEDGIANSYTLELEGLRVLDLCSEQYSVLGWLAVLMHYRLFAKTTPTMQKGSVWLEETFNIDLSNFDVVKGYRADDSYFGFARAFLRNEITLGQLSKAIRLGELGEQYALRSQAAFDALKFEHWVPADASIYWPQRCSKDKKARNDFKALLLEEDDEGLFLHELMQMGKEELDACLF